MEKEVNLNREYSTSEILPFHLLNAKFYKDCEFFIMLKGSCLRNFICNAQIYILSNYSEDVLCQPYICKWSHLLRSQEASDLYVSWKVCWNMQSSLLRSSLPRHWSKWGFYHCCFFLLLARSWIQHSLIFSYGQCSPTHSADFLCGKPHSHPYKT